MHMAEFDIAPDPEADGLTTMLDGLDASGQPVNLPVVAERPLTIYLNGQEIVTAMSLGDHIRELAVGFLYNQNMLSADDVITDIDIDLDIDVVVVRTEKQTNYESKLKKKIRTSGCAQGTVFGDIMDRFEQISLNPDVRLSVSQLMALSKTINTAPSLYLKAGAIHGCVLCTPERPVAYVEDIGRHNAVDKIAGHMFLNGISGHDKVFYTTGRLTSEMVIKTVIMNIPILVSRSGFTEAGVRLAREAGLTLIGRAKGSRFVALSAPERISFDSDVKMDSTSEQKSPQRQFNDAE
ncbi:MAG: formate dehydrogenase accessory sulfurtransferase FdhD [Candidatus Puniceispirillaceae bacterium]|nr:formate dehydrogenase accessory sulfurtransferase FdhD [Pseudomonadota bacterium]